MLNSKPIIDLEVAGELSNAAIETLAELLLTLAEQEQEARSQEVAKEPPSK